MLGVGELAREFGRTPRAVQTWFERGCPHGESVYCGRKVRCADPEVVSKWLREQGLRARRVQAETLPLGGASSPPQAPPLHAGPLPADAAGVLEVFTARAAELANGLLATDLEGLSTAERQQVASAVKQASGEVRQLVDALHKARERDGEFVARDEAAAALRQAAQVVRTQAEGLPVALADAAGLTPYLAPGLEDEARRVLVAGARKVVSEFLSRVAEMAARVGALGVEAA